jgi:hypothetical protein
MKMAGIIVKPDGRRVLRKNIWIDEDAWNTLKRMAEANGLSPSEELNELVLDAAYESGTERKR